MPPPKKKKSEVDTTSSQPTIYSLYFHYMQYLIPLHTAYKRNGIEVLVVVVQ